MFLILGHNECKFCLKSKTYLDDNRQDYIYIDLFLKFGKDKWRDVFKTLNVSQKSIPIIYQVNDSYNQDADLGKIKDLHLIGTYDDLVKYVHNLEITIDDDY